MPRSDPEALASTLGLLGAICAGQSKNPEAEAAYREAVEIRRRLSDRSKLAGALRGLADAYAAQGKDALAEPHYGEALEVYLDLLDPDPEAIAACRSQLEVLGRRREGR
jgi:tetratricopeptide (TPR) repeat protein